MVEMHLLAVNVDFHYDPFYGLGVFSGFNRFMQGYRPDQDKESIFDGLCKALQEDPQRYRHDSERLESLARRLSAKELVDWLTLSHSVDEVNDLQEHLRSIAHNPKFKYSRLFAIGLYSLLESADPEMVKDDTQRIQALKQICTALNVPEDKLQKDLDLYRSNLEKMAQARIVMEDALKAERKKREERERAKAVSTTGSSDSESKGEAASES